MKKIHVTVVALLLGVSAALGVTAATHTAGLRTTTAKTSVSRAAIAARSHRLDKVQVSMRRALHDRPPALPAMPKKAGPAPAPTQHVVYQRPAPIVVVKHGTHHDSESDHEGHSGGGDD
jgi:hypothetical protein